MTNQLIGTRIRVLTQARGLSQDELARLFGFKDRQTVSTIETGLRRITASELLLAVERFGVPLDYFTDPFRLDGEGCSPGDRRASSRIGWSSTRRRPDGGSVRTALWRRRSGGERR